MSGVVSNNPRGVGRVRISDLVEGYEWIRSTSQHDPLCSESGCTVLLHDGLSVRVFLTREPERWHEIWLEIEVLMPVGLRSRRDLSDSMDGSVEDSDDQQEVSRTQMEDCIGHMRYLSKLEAAGFRLEVVFDGCIWTARLPIVSVPDMNLLQIITPPDITK
ncbi:MAG: hypothetical protein JSW61_01380 [Candidatus Thorarchaeota archaeon]|nr:MAG: hypothetical protein JSW61_01380 [Candidatus Thorarchaeota archaeon]